PWSSRRFLRSSSSTRRDRFQPAYRRRSAALRALRRRRVSPVGTRLRTLWSIRLRLSLRRGVWPLERRGLLRDALADERDRHQERHSLAGTFEVSPHSLFVVRSLRRLARADGRVGDGRV